MDNKLINKFIPLDKSWIIRLGILDLLNGYDDIISFLNRENYLSDDLQALKKVINSWNNQEVDIDVGESGTLYRFLKFISWKKGLNKKFIKHGTLNERKIFNDPAIINFTTKELLKLDNNTSQWASASVLFGNKERISNPPFKLQLTYDAVSHWNEKRNKGEVWEVRYDKTILRQATAFINYLKTGKMEFMAVHSEDYCFARAFNLITKEEGFEKWSSLAGHESNRLEEMEKYLGYFEKGLEIDSKDHRILQAIAMLSLAKNKQISFSYSNAVNKSWPQFWNFLNTCKK
jgi:hypothetical protein